MIVVASVTKIPRTKLWLLPGGGCGMGYIGGGIIPGGIGGIGGTGPPGLAAKPGGIAPSGGGPQVAEAER